VRILNPSIFIFVLEFYLPYCILFIFYILRLHQLFVVELWLGVLSKGIMVNGESAISLAGKFTVDPSDKKSSKDIFPDLRSSLTLHYFKQ